MITNSFSLPITSNSMLVTIKLITINKSQLKKTSENGVGSTSVITEILELLLLMLDSLIEKLPNISITTNTSYLNISVSKLLTNHKELTVGTVG
jgi:hypothetical protein